MSVMRTKSIERHCARATNRKYQLKKSLTALDLTVFGVGVVIGAGIFTVAGRRVATGWAGGHRLVHSRGRMRCGSPPLLRRVRVRDPRSAGLLYTFSMRVPARSSPGSSGGTWLLGTVLGASVVAQGVVGLSRDLPLDHLGITIPRRSPMAALRPAGIPSRRRPDRARQHRDQESMRGQPGVGRGQGVHHRALRHRRRIGYIRRATLPLHPAVGADQGRQHHGVPLIWAVLRAHAAEPLRLDRRLRRRLRWSSSYIPGSDVVATTAERRRIRRGICLGDIIGSLIICTILCCATALVLTGMVRYDKLAESGSARRGVRAGGKPGFATPHLRWCGRRPDHCGHDADHRRELVVFAMSRDWLLPPALGKGPPQDGHAAAGSPSASAPSSPSPRP